MQAFHGKKRATFAFNNKKQGIIFVLFSLLCTFALIMKPLISFIITYHNEPKALLEACVESILALPLAEDEAEIIVVDDGSEVNLQSHNFTISQYVRQEQAGLSVARNTGISHAQGRYIQFVDADDCLIPSAYKAVIKHVKKSVADIVLFRMTKQAPSNSISKDSTSDGEHKTWSGSGASFLLHRNLRAAAWGYAFRREMLGNLQFCPGLLHEDELFTPQLFLKADTLCELDVRAYFYRQHEGTITNAKSSEKVQKRLDDIRFIIMEFKSLDEPLLERRVRQLTVDYLQKTMTLTHNFGELHRRTQQLHKEGFLPLPLRLYSLRYLIASLLLRFC